MNRRTFLGAMASATAGMVLDLDRTLWVPGRRTYFEPALDLSRLFDLVLPDGTSWTFRGHILEALIQAGHVSGLSYSIQPTGEIVKGSRSMPPRNAVVYYEGWPLGDVRHIEPPPVTRDVQTIEYQGQVFRQPGLKRCGPIALTVAWTPDAEQVMREAFHEEQHANGAKRV